MKAVQNLTVLFIILFLSINNLYSQEEYIPRNIKKAYDKGTRSLDGTPGPNYWQNSSEYDIKADFNPAARLLTGSEKIVYHNNSPDTLDRIVIRLYQNINKKNAARNFTLNSDLITEGMTISNLKLRGEEMDLSSYREFGLMGTLFTISLKDNPLHPHSDIQMDIDWNFTLPEGENIRMGTYDSTSFLIGYWIHRFRYTMI